MCLAGTTAVPCGAVPCGSLDGRPLPLSEGVLPTFCRWLWIQNLNQPWHPKRHHKDSYGWSKKEPPSSVRIHRLEGGGGGGGAVDMLKPSKGLLLVAATFLSASSYFTSLSLLLPFVLRYGATPVPLRMMTVYASISRTLMA